MPCLAFKKCNFARCISVTIFFYVPPSTNMLARIAVIILTVLDTQTLVETILCDVTDVTMIYVVNVH